MDRPAGITGLELSQELSLSMAATHKHVSLLVEKGIVARRVQEGHSYAYSIKEEYRPQVARVTEQL
ncbi:MAG TPA: hypothetical protein VK436_08185 [Methanocella sp.]|nr:hypothetical protein [Methanocella sp.]